MTTTTFIILLTIATLGTVASLIALGFIFYYSSRAKKLRIFLNKTIDAIYVNMYPELKILRESIEKSLAEYNEKAGSTSEDFEAIMEAWNNLKNLTEEYDHFLDTHSIEDCVREFMKK